MLEDGRVRRHDSGWKDVESERDTMNVDDAAAEVYGVPLADFVATRNALAKQADDRSIAARIRGLRKPTVAAWLANQLARRCRDELDELVRTGEDMRAATAERDGQRLRQLGGRGRELVDALVRRAGEIAHDGGQPVSTEVTDAVGDTLRAAMAEPAAADAVLAGRLTRPLEHVGFGMPGTGAPADVISLEKARTARRRESGATKPSRAGGRDVPARRPATDDRADAEQADAGAETRVGSGVGSGVGIEPEPTETGSGADHELTETEASVEEVDAELELELAQADAAVEDADAMVERLTARRRTAKQRLAEARRARSRARDRVESTQRTFGRAEREVERLRQELDEAERTLDGARADVDGATDRLGRADQELHDADEALENAESELDRAHEESAAARERHRKARQRLDRPLS